MHDTVLGRLVKSGIARTLLGVACLLGALAPAAAADEQAIAPLKALVTDQTATLTPAQRESLEARLRAFEARKGSQLAVLMVETTQPEAIEPYAMRVVEQWKLGRKQADDGALLLVAKRDRTLRIEVGYGLEGVLNDATSKRIISEIIVPRFKQDDYFGGIERGVDQIIKLIDGEPLPPAPSRSAASETDLNRLAPVLLVVAVLVGGVLRAALGRLPGAALTAGGIGLIVWFLSGLVAIALLGALLGFVVTLLGGRGGRHGGGLGRGGFGGGGFRGGGGG